MSRTSRDRGSPWASGYTLESLFAADGIGGYNYPIIANGIELYPKF